MHSLTSPQQFVSFDSEWHFARSDFRFEVLHMASSGSNKAGPDLREQLEKGGAAEHAPSESSKTCSVSKSAGSATSIPDAGQMSSGSNIGSTEGIRCLHRQHRRHSPKAMREQAAPKTIRALDLESRGIPPPRAAQLHSEMTSKGKAAITQQEAQDHLRHQQSSQSLAGPRSIIEGSMLDHLRHQHRSRSRSRPSLEHRGVTEHVSPGCSATGPQQSDQIHRRASPVCNDDDDSDGYSDRKNRSSDSEGEIAYKLDAITIEYRFPSGESACRSLSISYWGLSCGVLWFHLRCCRVDMDNVKLLVGTQVINEYMKIELLTSVREQLQATPGVLRITVVRSL